MKIDRRIFVKALAFGGGGALGLLSSRLPWQLMRDLARWTQNWPWVPRPPYGKPSFEKSICGMCEGGCGIRVRKLGARLVRVDGDSDHPVNNGPVCPLGTAALQSLYGPSRIKQPLRRVGTKEDPQWQPISWAEAIDEVATRIGSLRASSESHMLACITSNKDSTVNELFERFLQAVGSRNFTKMTSGKDARRIVLKLMQGVEGDPAYDLENARLILSFGCSLLEGWGTCGRMYRSYSKWYDGKDRTPVEIVQIEPHLSTTATKASQWVPIKPGTDTALALGLAHVIIANHLYDKEFIDTHCFGFEDWKDATGNNHRGFKSLVLSEYSPSAVEKMTTVPAKDIENLAQKFATNGPALAVPGKGSGDLFVDLYEFMAVHALNALVGNINKPGGILVKQEAPISRLSSVVMDEEATRGYSVERIDGAGSPDSPFAEYLPDNLPADRIKILFVHEANPYYALADRNTAEALFKDVPYVVSFSSYMHETAARSDLILPLPTRFERWEDQYPAPELHYAIYSINHPTIEPLYETRSAGDILIEIARALGGTVSESFPWENTEEVLKVRAKGLYESGRGIINVPETITALEEGLLSPDRIPPNYSSFSSMWESLSANSCWFDPRKYDYGKPERVLQSPNGKFEFYSRQLKDAFQFADDVKCMPHYDEAPVGKDGFDLVVIPENMLVMGDDGKDTPPFLIKQLSDRVLLKDELFVRINPITAMYRNLNEGDAVELETPQGKVKVRLHTFEGIREGTVLIPLGFGHSAYDEFLRNKGVNARQVLEVKKDPVSGLPVWWATPGRLIKA